MSSVTSRLRLWLASATCLAGCVAQRPATTTTAAAPIKVAPPAVAPPRRVIDPNAPVAVAPNYWKYETTSSAGPSQRIVWEGGSDDFNGAHTFYIDSVVISEGGATRSHQRTFYDKASDGLHYVGARGDVESAQSYATANTTLSSPVLVLPMPFQADAKWNVKTTVRVATETERGAKNGPKSSSVSASPLDGESAVTGREQLTLPIGTFDCLVVRSSTTTQTLPDTEHPPDNIQTIKTTTVSWYAPTIGLVKSESTEDVESGLSGNTTTQRRTATTVLAVYHVTKPSWEMDAVGFVSDSPPGDSQTPAIVDAVPPTVVATAPTPRPPVTVAAAPQPEATVNVSAVSPAPAVVPAGSGLPHPIGMADLSSASYFSLVSRFGYFGLGNIGTGSATAVGILIEPRAEIAVTPAIKVQGGVPAAMVVAFYSDTAGSSSSDMGFTLGNLWLGGRYIRRLPLPNGSTLDLGGDLTVFLPTAHDSAKNAMSMSIAAGGASRLAEAFESAHEIGRYAPDQTTIHLAGDARMRRGQLFGQVELGIDQAWYTTMGMDGSQLWFRASLGGGALLGASKGNAVLAELTMFSDFLDSSSGEGFRSALDIGFQFRKEKQLMNLSLYFPIDSFSRDHDYIGLQFTTHFGF